MNMKSEWKSAGSRVLTAFGYTKDELFEIIRKSLLRAPRKPDTEGSIKANIQIFEKRCDEKIKKLPDD